MSQKQELSEMLDQLKYSISAAFAKHLGETPPECLKSEDGDGPVETWLTASCELVDRDGDLVRVDGIDTTEFSRNGAIKLLVAHLRSPDASHRLPIVGKVNAWRKVRHAKLGVPALMAGIQWAPTTLAQEYRSMVDGGWVTDCSIGFKPIRSTPLKGGGVEFHECALAELSLCVTGSNHYAGTSKSGDDGGTVGGGVEALIDAKLAAFAKQIELKMDDREDSIVVLIDRLYQKQVVATDDDDEGDDDPPVGTTDKQWDEAELKQLGEALHRVVDKLGEKTK